MTLESKRVKVVDLSPLAAVAMDRLDDWLLDYCHMYIDRYEDLYDTWVLIKISHGLWTYWGDEYMAYRLKKRILGEDVSQDVDIISKIQETEFYGDEDVVVMTVWKTIYILYVRYLSEEERMLRYKKPKTMFTPEEQEEQSGGV